MKKSIFTFILFMLLNITVFSSENTINDLENKLSTAKDTEKIQILNELSEKYLDLSPHKSIDYSQEALKLSQKLKAQKEIIESMNFLGIAYFSLSNLEEASNYFNQAITSNQNLNDVKGLAFSYNGLGLVNNVLGKYNEALDYFLLALDAYKQVNDQEGTAYSLNNIGAIKDTQGQYEEALDYYLQALDLNITINNREEMATCYNNIGYVYFQLEYYNEAFEYYMKALHIYEQLSNNDGTATVLSNIAKIYSIQQEFDRALTYYSKALDLYMKLDYQESIANTMNNIGYIYEFNQDYSTALQFYLNALDILESIGAKEGMINSYNNIGTIYHALEEPESALTYHLKSLEASKMIDYNYGIQLAYKNISYDYSQLKQFEKAFEYYEKYSELKDSLITDSNRKTIAEMETKYESTKKQHQIELLQKDNKIKTFKYWLQLGISILAIIILFIVALLGYIIWKERKKSEKLLLNILPPKVANDLKKKGKTDPQNFENVTVYFSDIIGFTKLSSSIEPKKLICELNDLFTEFDNIMEKHNCTRIKTIGDAYFAVCGLPNEDKKHAHNMINASIDILDYLNKRNSSSSMDWHIRIGIHSGNVVGGIVGIKKYIYDVFGDTVNTASRMESNSEAMKINISQSTFELVQKDYTLIKRNPIEVKGKGLMNMYFVETTDN